MNSVIGAVIEKMIAAPMEPVPTVNGATINTVIEDREISIDRGGRAWA